ncbi:hypothetical protein BOTCAL_0263g00050 [Botryotinia calthae]|uniref:Uncharacterized protein n=1 Tax=Botryotinia calthae TaxID=38488 RepID=A0A4Y8CW42_9HELO|nr:hypothetical protein BOTCAL_0263g00050 [Botryotinia calthae]
MDSLGLNTKAQILVQTLTNQVCQQHGSGNMSTAIYATAWVSMITRSTNSGMVLLFPESYQYILEPQARDGDWETYASTDQEAEAYLRSAITSSIARGTGSVPCAFPITIFETTWILTILMKSNFSSSVLGLYNLNILSEFLKKEFRVQGGILDSASATPLILADTDVTSKTIETLSLLGDFVSPDNMISTYETATHFNRMGPNETLASAQIAIVEDPSCYIKQIVKAASFLCEIWSLGKVKDKWACINPVHRAKPSALTETS